jgi:hypothetical protein
MDVYLIDPSKPLSEDSPSYTTDEMMAITGVDLYALAKGKLLLLLFLVLIFITTKLKKLDKSIFMVLFRNEF